MGPLVQKLWQFKVVDCDWVNFAQCFAEHKEGLFPTGLTRLVTDITGVAKAVLQ